MLVRLRYRFGVKVANVVGFSSHDRFKQCVLKETRRLCDRGVPDGPALRFASHLIDKALKFLQDQCYNYM